LAAKGRALRAIARDQKATGLSPARRRGPRRRVLLGQTGIPACQRARARRNGGSLRLARRLPFVCDLDHRSQTFLKIWLKRSPEWGAIMPSSATDKDRGSSPLKRPAGRPALSPKMIGGIGATLTLVAVAALLSGGPKLSPELADPAAQEYTTTAAAPSPASAPTAPVPYSAPAMALVAAPASASAPAYASPAPAQKQCRLPQRKFYVSGSGTVRVHDGIYVSAPVVLDIYPQEVVFPLARPESGTSADDTITVEGNASTVIMTSDYPDFRQVFRRLKGSTTFTAHWVSLRNC
jgi:hypothetical protein